MLTDVAIIKDLIIEPYSAIYIGEGDEVLGTGHIFLSPGKSMNFFLQVNLYYKRLGQIERVYFIENKKRYSEYISSDKYDTSKSDSVYLNHRILLMNPKSSLNDDERKLTFQTLQSYLYD
ncbi:hypothetical protein ETI06_13075 [Macrococcoides goetzii]|nr:hypothetical protein [Macrococcus goetzii]TDM39884.1 hypothetical protein ETI08_13350 [Macrococcus goetzii]TDM45107.1 hypothetical protein ETI06_13075 [Macrococcus goetzii]